MRPLRLVVSHSKLRLKSCSCVTQINNTNSVCFRFECQFVTVSVSVTESADEENEGIIIRRTKLGIFFRKRTFYSPEGMGLSSQKKRKKSEKCSKGPSNWKQMFKLSSRFLFSDLLMIWSAFFKMSWISKIRSSNNREMEMFNVWVKDWVLIRLMLSRHTILVHSQQNSLS